MNEKYGCHVHSFDPYSEGERFKKARLLQKTNNDNRVIQVNKKWNFYRIGLAGVEQPAKKIC
jgi:hypothetical protein